jgi:membrane-associated phospholipid phosphatase
VREVEEAADSPPHALRNATPGRLALAFGAVVLFFIGFSVATGDPLETCRWCTSNEFDETIRKWLVADDARTAGLLSHVFSIGILPALAIGATVVPGALTRARRHFGAQDFAILIVAFLMTTAVTDGVKKLAERERPGFHHERALLLEAAQHPLERNLSFFSGDTAWAFAFAACAFTLARLRGYRTERWIGIAGFVCATIAGILRIVADMHWASDVIVGAIVGTTIGVVLPTLIHPRAVVDAKPL